MQAYATEVHNRSIRGSTERTKGLFTHFDPVSDPDPVTVKFYNCANGDGPSDGQNGFHTHSARQPHDTMLKF